MVVGRRPGNKGHGDTGASWRNPAAFPNCAGIRGRRCNQRRGLESNDSWYYGTWRSRQAEWREDLPIPSPAAGEVLIRVGASAVTTPTSTCAPAGIREACAHAASTAADRGDGADRRGNVPRWAPIAAAPSSRSDGGRPGADRPTCARARAAARPRRGLATRTPGTDYDGAFAEYLVVADADALGSGPIFGCRAGLVPLLLLDRRGQIQRVGLGAERACRDRRAGGRRFPGRQIQLAKAGRARHRDTAPTRPMLSGARRRRCRERDAAFPPPPSTASLRAGGPRWPALIDPRTRALVVSGACRAIVDKAPVDLHLSFGARTSPRACDLVG